MGRVGSLGLIAGQGALPAVAAAFLRQSGHRLALFGFDGLKTSADVPVEDRLPLGALSLLRARLAERDVTRVLIVGRFDLAWLATSAPNTPRPPAHRDRARAEPARHSPFAPDKEARRILAGLERFDGVTIMGAVADWLAEQGLELLAQDATLGPLVVEEGVLARRVPSKEEEAAIRPALHALAACEAGSLAQSVAVRGHDVLLVESGSGTDDLIERAGRQAPGQGFTVVKAARPGQDRRLDLPAVGVETIEVMAAAGATGLALEAGSVLLIDRKALREAADRAGIAVWGFERESLVR
jgi:DUF1009 family protein